MFGRKPPKKVSKKLLVTQYKLLKANDENG
jgi:hypothetical protein